MLNFSHGDQHIIINGKATPQATDSIEADLKDVDVAYILNLVNFTRSTLPEKLRARPW